MPPTLRPSLLWLRKGDTLCTIRHNAQDWHYTQANFAGLAIFDWNLVVTVFPA